MISKIIAIENYTLELHLNDGSIRYFDVKPYLDYPAFSNLKNKDYFNKCEMEELEGVDWKDYGGSLSKDTLIAKSYLKK